MELYKGKGDEPIRISLTNWQRNQWARAGYKGTQLHRFSRLDHNSRIEIYKGFVIVHPWSNAHE